MWPAATYGGHSLNFPLAPPTLPPSTGLPLVVWGCEENR